jgi:hypothetical protein
MTTDTDIHEITATPDVKALGEHLKSLITEHGDIYDRRTVAQDLRQCRWDGQSADGRKHREDLGHEPFPFEGATDSRVRLTDTIIGEKKAMLVETALKAMPEVAGMESRDMELAARMRTLFLYLRDNKLPGQLRRELTLAAEYMLADDPGVAVMGVWWHKVTAHKREELSLPMIQARITAGMDEQQAGQVMSNVQALIFDPTLEQQALDALTSLYPHATKAQVSRALKALRTGSSAVMPAPYVRESSPRIVAYRLWEDIFFPIENTDPETWEKFFLREEYTAVELREKVNSEGWDADWVEEVISKAKGKSYVLGAQHGYGGASVTGTRDIYEVWRALVRAVDEQGVPEIYMTVFMPDIADTWALHAPLGYEHGRMPVVVFSREIMSRSAKDSRGITELVGVHQNEIKVHRDTRGDNAQLSTAPAMKVHMRRAGARLVIAPNAQIPVQRSDDLEYMQLPQYPAASVEMERAVKQEADELTARRTPTTDPVRVEMVSQFEVNSFLDAVRDVWRQMLQLCQQFMEPSTFTRVVGGQQQSYQMSPDDIRGQFDLRLSFDVRDTNIEFLTTKLDYFAKIASLDRSGALDTAGIVREGMRALDPSMAELVVRDQGSVTKQEIKDEQTNAMMMLAGIEPEMQEGGQNFALRAQTLQQTIQQSPVLQSALQQNQAFAGLVERRMKHFGFMQQQQANAQTGRVGVQQKN